MMRRMRGLGRIGAAEALEAGVERARLALACTFSSSAEYEDSIIQAKRDAGVYGPKQRRRRLLLWFLAATVPIAFVILIFAFRDK
jgi:hypothetical protein